MESTYVGLAAAIEKKILKYITMPNNTMEVIFDVIFLGGFNIAISWFLKIMNEVKESGEELDEKAEELISSAEEFKKLIVSTSPRYSRKNT